MKKLLVLLAGFCFLTACNENGDPVESKLDSLENHFDTTAEKIWDSTKAKAKDLKEKLEEKWEQSKDSIEARKSDTLKDNR